MDYKKAGVNLAAADLAVEKIKDLAASTKRPEVIDGIGGFGGLFALDTARYRSPVLVAGTDGVGTKLKIAFAMDEHRTVGIDCVAMCVNDILVQGAEPVFFLDYLAVGVLKPEQVADIVAGVAAGCRKAGCALLGGETAEMPGFYAAKEYDLAGFAVGVVERDRLVDGSRIEAGDVMIGFPANGFHSNGYSLLRKVIETEEINLAAPVPAEYRVKEEQPFTLGRELLRPTEIYVPVILPLLKQFDVRGMVHVTGGGLPGNIPRILPAGLRMRLAPGSWEVPGIFRYFQHKGNISEEEMFRVFNMGIGFVLIVPENQAAALLKEARNACPVVIGEVTRD